MKSKEVNRIWMSVIFILLGAGLAIWRTAALSAVVWVAAFALLAAGAANTIIQILDRTAKKREKLLHIALALVCAVAGVAILCAPAFFEGFVQILIGAAIILFNARELYTAFRAKKHWAFLTLPALGVILGAVVITDPFAMARTFAIIAGLCLAYTGGVILADEVRGHMAKESDNN